MLTDDCIFCKIIRDELPSSRVYENEHVVAFHDIQPQARYHVLIIPKKHLPTLNDVQPDDMRYIAEIHTAAQQVAKSLGIDASGYRLVNNCNKEGGQVVYHLHYHVLGGEQLGPIVAG